jgi:hypothetical protein
MEQEAKAVARQRYRKHISAATNTHGTLEKPQEAVFSLRSVASLYSENQQGKLVSCESGPSTRSWWLDTKQKNPNC